MKTEAGGQGKEQILNLVVPATAQYLALVRLVVGAAARVIGLNDDNVADIKVALSEASTNVIRHAYRSGGHQRRQVIEVTCYEHGGSLVIEVVDHGDGMPLPPPASEGLGFGIIGSLMDKVNVETGESGTTVHMVKEYTATRHD